MCDYIGCRGAIPLVEICRFEPVNKVVEEKVFIDCVMVRGAELKDYIFFDIFAAFCVSLVLILLFALSRANACRNVIFGISSPGTFDPQRLYRE